MRHPLGVPRRVRDRGRRAPRHPEQREALEARGVDDRSRGPRARRRARSPRPPSPTGRSRAGRSGPAAGGARAPGASGPRPGSPSRSRGASSSWPPSRAADPPRPRRTRAACRRGRDRTGSPDRGALRGTGAPACAAETPNPRSAPAPTSSYPRPRTVRMTRWSRPSSPSTLRSALIRVVSADSVTNRWPQTDSSSSSLVTTRPCDRTRCARTSNAFGST